jgi:hypothetical protein
MSALKPNGRAVDSDGPYDVGDILLDEFKAVEMRRAILLNTVGISKLDDVLSADPTKAKTEKLANYYALVHAKGDLSALSLSGGGIRSAAFGLGVIQGLAARKLLHKFDYLSTVSGGGYIGAFLTAWVQREGYADVSLGLADRTEDIFLGLRSKSDQPVHATEGATPGSCKKAENVIAENESSPEHPDQNQILIPEPRSPAKKDIHQTSEVKTDESISHESETDEENEQFAPLQHLRRYSSYLTPHKGLISSDTLTIIALYVRNLLLNWFVLLPVVLIGILAIKLFAVLTWAPPPTPEIVGALGIVTVTAVGLAVLDSLRQRPGWESDTDEVPNFEAWELTPLFIGGLLAAWAALQLLQRPRVGDGPIASASLMSTLLQLALIGGAVWAIAWIIAFLLSKPEDKKKASTKETIRTSGWKQAVWAASWFTVFGALTGILLGLSFYGVDRIGDWWGGADPAKPDEAKAILLFCFGPLLLASALFFAELLYVGLTSYTPWSEGEREWLGRAAGYHGRFAMGWAVLGVLIFGGSAALVKLYSAFPGYKLEVSTYLVSIGGVAGAITALLGKTSTTVATLGKLNKTWKNFFATAALTFTAPIFVIITVSLASIAIDVISTGKVVPLGFSNIKEFWTDISTRLGVIFVIVFLFGVGASRAINTNRFSLHALYRNRLIRAFLGASNRDRHQNPFTDFDEKDNEQLSNLWPNQRKRNCIPPQLFVINCALNILATKELAWQERKALSFTASARAIGCGALHGVGAYRPSAKYGSGMTLGTAITISGAAASPNMGYHSSPALSVLLTLFNVRLGAWLGNPGEHGARTYKFQGPLYAAVPLVQEALGRTSDDKPYVYLSDGGHFENLGLYEMVRRRCHLIVLSDGGCDPACSFEDLGNAVRKIWIDLKVKIDFKKLKISPRSVPPQQGPYCAVGAIHYPEEGAKAGLLLYIKPGFQGTEPVSVGSYAATSSAFPHESTGEQLFGESQFEAYRALGEYIVSTIDGGKPGPYSDIESFISIVSQRLDGGSTSNSIDEFW